MKLEKIIVAGLSISAFLFTSCANSVKELTRDEVIDFITKNYTSTEPRSPKSSIEEYFGKAANKESKKALDMYCGIYLFVNLNDDLHYKSEVIKRFHNENVLSPYDIPISDGYVYTLRDKELTQQLPDVVSEIETEDFDTVAKLSSSIIYNSAGFRYKYHSLTTVEDEKYDISYSVEHTITYFY